MRTQAKPAPTQIAVTTPARTMALIPAPTQTAAITPAKTTGMKREPLVAVITTRVRATLVFSNMRASVRRLHQPVQITAIAVERHTSQVTPVVDKQAAHLTVQAVDMYRHQAAPQAPPVPRPLRWEVPAMTLVETAMRVRLLQAAALPRPPSRQILHAFEAAKQAHSP